MYAKAIQATHTGLRARCKGAVMLAGWPVLGL